MKMIAYCGTVCSKCEAFEATKNDDDILRAKTAETWSKKYGSDIKPEDINCNGCMSENGTLFNYCTMCGIRKCGKEKGVQTCAHCSEYGCEQLLGFFQLVPEAKDGLDEIRKKLDAG